MFRSYKKDIRFYVDQDFYKPKIKVVSYIKLKKTINQRLITEKLSKSLSI